jgi:transcription initiation factor TFIIB
MSESSIPVEECPGCGAENITYWEELETWICDDCSYVIEMSTSKTSSPTLPKDLNRNKVEEETWSQSISVKDKSEANLVDVLSQVETISDELALPGELAIRAAEVVVEAWKINFMHGRTKPDTVGASVYAASREAQQGIPPAIIADKIESDRKTVKKTYQQLKTELQLNIDPPRPLEYLEHICYELNLPSGAKKTAEEILAGHSAGGNPVGIAAAGVYVASEIEGEDLTLRRAAKVTDLTKETIWRQAERIREKNQKDI